MPRKMPRSLLRIRQPGVQVSTRLHPGGTSPVVLYSETEVRILGEGPRLEGISRDHRSALRVALSRERLYLWGIPARLPGVDEDLFSPRMCVRKWLTSDRSIPTARVIFREPRPGLDRLGGHRSTTIRRSVNPTPRTCRTRIRFSPPIRRRSFLSTISRQVSPKF